MNPLDFFIAASPEHQRKEKQKARELRSTQWWKNQLGRGVCHHCGQRFHPSELTMDHLLPIARGGITSKGNTVPSCKPCNTLKGHTTAVDKAFAELRNQTPQKREPIDEPALPENYSSPGSSSSGGSSLTEPGSSESTSIS